MAKTRDAAKDLRYQPEKRKAQQKKMRDQDEKDNNDQASKKRKQEQQGKRKKDAELGARSNLANVMKMELATSKFQMLADEAFGAQQLDYMLSWGSRAQHP